MVTVKMMLFSQVVKINLKFVVSEALLFFNLVSYTCTHSVLNPRPHSLVKTYKERSCQLGFYFIFFILVKEVPVELKLIG